MQNYGTLASLCSLVESNLVANLEDRFSRVAAHFTFCEPTVMALARLHKIAYVISTLLTWTDQNVSESSGTDKESIWW